MRPDRHRRRVLAAVAVLALALGGCNVLEGNTAEAGGNDVEARRGRELIVDYGCGSCHTIPGVRDADGLVAPPLTHMARRGYIAGAITNTPDNLARWIADPEEIEPGTAMPDLGVTPEQARQIAAYLHTLD